MCKAFGSYIINCPHFFMPTCVSTVICVHVSPFICLPVSWYSFSSHKKKKKNYFFLFISLFGVSCLPAVFLAGIGVQSQTMRERVSKEGMSYPNPVIRYAISEPLRQSIFSPYQFFDKCFFSSKEYAISYKLMSEGVKLVCFRWIINLIHKKQSWFITIIFCFKL